jgi:hypothetical protein
MDDRSVDSATRYRLDVPGIESRWRRYLPPPSRPVVEPTQPPIYKYRGYSGLSMTLTTHTYIAPRLKKAWSFTSIHLLGLRGLF